MPRLAVAILAGGQGERLGGVNKALLDIGGTRLLDRVLAKVGGVGPVVLCGGGNSFPPDLPIAPQHRLEDLPADYAGPLAGLASAVEFLARTDPPGALLTVAVDTPFFPSDFAARALPLLTDADVVLAAFGGQDYPTNAVWRFAAIAGLADAVRAGTAPHSLKRLAASLSMARLDYTQLAPDDPFANANTPAELAVLRARARP